MRMFHLILLLLALTYLTSQAHSIYDLSSLSEKDLDGDDLIEVE
jgi:competence protein ComGF